MFCRCLVWGEMPALKCHAGYQSHKVQLEELRCWTIGLQIYPQLSNKSRVQRSFLHLSVSNCMWTSTLSTYFKIYREGRQDPRRFKICFVLHYCCIPSSLSRLLHCTVRTRGFLDLKFRNWSPIHFSLDISRLDAVWYKHFISFPAFQISSVFAVRALNYIAFKCFAFSSPFSTNSSLRDDWQCARHEIVPTSWLNVWNTSWEQLSWYNVCLLSFSCLQLCETRKTLDIYVGCFSKLIMLPIPHFQE